MAKLPEAPIVCVHFDLDGNPYFYATEGVFMLVCVDERIAQDRVVAVKERVGTAIIEDIIRDSPIHSASDPASIRARAIIKRVRQGSHLTVIKGSKKE